MPVVVGFIPTNEGRAALERAIEESKLRGEKLIVVGSNKGGDEFVKQGLNFDEELEKVTDRLEADGVDHEVHALVRGKDPAEDLVEVADRMGAKLIVIGLRRRSPVGKLIMGSNAQRILLDANCDVLAVKPTSR
ncbi:universal stress protein [Cumulibacter manganitolerans]|uniref:universal stress protein n=1 Tax=Cumulibacter manganitolerans TaxID=1884992 RepID=UPI001296B62B|nr:universal stress protein [Cumulibacter manganitolerans]